MNRAAPLPFVLAALALPTPGCKKDEAPPAPAPSPAPSALGATGALAGFEGEIEVKVKSGARASTEQTLLLQVKGARLRMDVPPGLEQAPGLGNAPRVIFDVKAQKMTALVDERKMAIEMDLSRFADQAKSFAGTPSPGAAPAGGAPPKITRTGRTDTVAGYKCEEWDILAPAGEQSTVCVAGESAPFFAFPTASLPPDQAWAREVFDGKHLPLRFVSKGRTGVEETRIEVRKIEKKTLSEDVFAVPAGYQVMNMAEMTQRMMGGMPSALSPGLAAPPGVQIPQLPQGLALPPGVQMPQGVQMPPEAARMLKEMQERAKAAQQPKK